MIRAFTGPSKMTAAQLLWATERIAAYRPVGDVWRSGCAHGLDSLAARMAYALTDLLDLELYVPHAAHNESLVRVLAPRAQVIRCPRGATVAESYRIRNAWMVNGVVSATAVHDVPRADVLHAFIFRDSFYRSGEWMTLNLARNAGVDVVREVIPA